MVISVIPEQFSNMLLPIALTVVGMVMLFNPLQPENAFEPIVSVAAGIFN